MKYDTQSITIREYFDAKIADIDKNTELTRNAMEKRLEGMNEFRDQLRDQAGRFITRDEANLIVGRLEVDIKNLQLAKAVLEGKASQQSVNVATILSVIALILGIVGAISRFI